MQDERNVTAITDMDVDFAKWYTDIVVKAGLIDYSGLRGFTIMLPHGYAIWELIKGEADKRFKATGHVNVAMPLLIPESLLQKEKDHVQGFAPEVAWVTHGGEEKLQERMCIRPTSEVLFCDHYANAIQSWRDLPKLYNQWCSIVRWEKSTRPFLRGREFHWQEGHTAHATAEEALEETLRMLDVYADICENVLCVPVIKGRKTESDKFAGALATYCLESLMHDGKALQAGTTHNFGDGFARAFGIQYTDKSNKLQYVHQTSWGITTRLIGAVIMVHGDNNGLVLPPEIAPIQVAIVPAAQQKPGVLEKSGQVKELLDESFRVILDDSDKSMGWKCAEYEMRGVPVRLELGPRDIAENKCVLARRDTGEKITVSLEGIEGTVRELLSEIKKAMYEKALKRRDEKTYSAANYAEFEALIENKPGFIKAMWCGSESCEDSIKERTTATSRCIPFEGQQEKLSEVCVCCGEAAECMVVWGKAY